MTGLWRRPVAPSISAFPSRVTTRSGAPCVPSPLAGEGQGGGKLDGSRNRFQNALTVGHDIVIVEAQNMKAFVGKVSISPSIALLLS